MNHTENINEVIEIQTASSGMLAFRKGLDVHFLVALLYDVRPVLLHLGPTRRDLLRSA